MHVSIVIPRTSKAFCFSSFPFLSDTLIHKDPYFVTLQLLRFWNDIYILSFRNWHPKVTENLVARKNDTGCWIFTQIWYIWNISPLDLLHHFFGSSHSTFRYQPIGFSFLDHKTEKMKSWTTFQKLWTISYVMKNYNRSGIWFASHFSPRKSRILFLSTSRGCFWQGILHICFPDFSNSRSDLRMIGPEIRFTLLDLGSVSALLKSSLGLGLWSFALVKQWSWWAWLWFIESDKQSLRG